LFAADPGFRRRDAEEAFRGLLRSAVVGSMRSDNVGAYLGVVGPLMATANAVKNTPSVYRTPLIEVSSKVMFTNTSPVSAYRGAGRPEGNYYMERLIDTAAREMGIDRLELRRRNHIRPEEIPFKAASDMLYDSGDFGAVFEERWLPPTGRVRERKAESRSTELRGIGGSYLEVTAPPNKGKRRAPLRARRRRDPRHRHARLRPGHAAPFAQVLSAPGHPFDKDPRLAQGDSATRSCSAAAPAARAR
jgi:carbon-monoxide dehydrogenase large subunit